MANTIRIKRRSSSGASGAPSALKNGELAFNEADNTLYYGYGDDGSGNATSIPAISGTGAYVNLTTNQTIGGTKTFSNTIVGSISGNAATATRWATTRTITMTGDVTADAVNIDGSGNITITNTAVANDSHTHNANNLTGTTLASNVVNSSLTNVGTLTGLTSSGSINITDTLESYKINGSSVLSSDTLGSSVTSSSLTSVGTISLGVWQATDIGIAYGGTGASNASDARDNLGLTIGTDVQAWDANLDDIAGLSDADGNFIVGSAGGWVAESGATARTSLGLGNVENTALSTWAGSTNIVTVGTISAGTWQATDIGIAYGGTGASTAAGARSNLGLEIGVDIDAAGTDNSTPVSLAGTVDYITAGGTDNQTLTLNKIDLTTDVTGALPAANVGSLPTSKITSGTFANARISSSSVTQHSGDITEVGTLDDLDVTGDVDITSGDLNITAGDITLTAGALKGPSTFYIDPSPDDTGEPGGATTDTGTVVILGDLTVQGTTTTVNSTVVEIVDPTFNLASNSSGSGLVGAGIIIGNGSPGDKTMTIGSGGDFTFNDGIVAVGASLSADLDMNGNDILDAVIDGGTF